MSFFWLAGWGLAAFLSLSRWFFAGLLDFARPPSSIQMARFAPAVHYTQIAFSDPSYPDLVAKHI
jgi:hypothetical protein